MAMELVTLLDLKKAKSRWQRHKRRKTCGSWRVWLAGSLLTVVRSGPSLDERILKTMLDLIHAGSSSAAGE